MSPDNAPTSCIGEPMPNTYEHKTLKSGIDSNLDAQAVLLSQGQRLKTAVQCSEFYRRLDAHDDQLRAEQARILNRIHDLENQAEASVLVDRYNEIQKERDILEEIDDRVHTKDERVTHAAVHLNRRARNFLILANQKLEELARWLTKRLVRAS